MMFMGVSRGPRDPEAVMLRRCEQAALKALRDVLDSQKTLGERGKKIINTNQFGDRQILADVQCEAAVMRAFQQHDLPVRVVAEEHGLRNLHQAPRLLLVLDGLDGSASFSGRAPAGSVGTLFTLYSALEPSYREYICAGMADFRRERLYLAVRGEGLQVYDGINRSRVLLQPARFPFSEDPVSGSIAASGAVYGQRLKDLQPLDYYSWVEALRRLFDGECQGVIESTRKGNLEAAALYALVCEAGGAVITLDGSDLGRRNFLVFGQQSAEGIIAARSAEAAEALRLRLLGGS